MFNLWFKKIFVGLFLTLNIIIVFYMLYIVGDLFTTNGSRGHIWGIIFLAFILLVNYFLYDFLVKTKYAGIITVTCLYSFMYIFLKSFHIIS